MKNKTKNANEIFAFKTKTDRDGFISDLPSGVRYAVNIQTQHFQTDGLWPYQKQNLVLRRRSK